MPRMMRVVVLAVAVAVTFVAGRVVGQDARLIERGEALVTSRLSLKAR